MVEPPIPAIVCGAVVLINAVLISTWKQKETQDDAVI
jgi:hypothetical protein